MRENASSMTALQLLLEYKKYKLVLCTVLNTALNNIIEEAGRTEIIALVDNAVTLYCTCLANVLTSLVHIKV